MYADNASLDTDPFADAESARARVDGVLHRLDAAYVPVARLTGMLRSAFLFASSAAGCLMFWKAADELGNDVKLLIVGLVVVLNLFLAGLGWVWPKLVLARTTWRVGAGGMEIKRGVLFRHVLTIPGSRIQHMDVSQGPIERRFELGTLVIHTAGTHASETDLYGVTREMALAARDFLLDKAAGQADAGDGA